MSRAKFEHPRQFIPATAKLSTLLMHGPLEGFGFLYDHNCSSSSRALEMLMQSDKIRRQRMLFMQRGLPNIL